MGTHSPFKTIMTYWHKGKFLGAAARVTKSFSSKLIYYMVLTKGNVTNSNIYAYIQVKHPIRLSEKACGGHTPGMPMMDISL